MSGRKNIGIFFFNAAIFVLLEIAALGLLSHSGTLQHQWFFRGFNAVNSVFWGTGETIGGYFSLRKQNDDLARENFELVQELRAYRESDRDLGSMDFETVGNFTYIHSVITKHGAGKQHNYLILNKGADDGVLNGSGVITPDGIVGIVDGTSRQYSHVMSFQNADMVISARIGRDGTVGPLSWDGISGRGALLKEIPLNNPFEEGDTVYTSGFSSLFPSDIPLGVLGESRIVNGSSFEIKVSLFRDISDTRYATVVINNDTEEITELVEGVQ